MNEKYRRYLEKKANTGCLNALHQLRRNGIEVEVEHSYFPDSLKTSGSSTKLPERILNERKTPYYLTLPLYWGK